MFNVVRSPKNTNQNPICNDSSTNRSFLSRIENVFTNTRTRITNSFQRLNTPAQAKASNTLLNLDAIENTDTPVSPRFSFPVWPCCFSDAAEETNSNTGETSSLTPTSRSGFETIRQPANADELFEINEDNKSNDDNQSCADTNPCLDLHELNKVWEERKNNADVFEDEEDDEDLTTNTKTEEEKFQAPNDEQENVTNNKTLEQNANSKVISNSKNDPVDYSEVLTDKNCSNKVDHTTSAAVSTHRQQKKENTPIQRNQTFRGKYNTPQLLNESAIQLEIANELNSGIVESHITAIKRFCKIENLFLMVRPTELASTRLIKYGYATKSMDIHHKSANEGIAKGFVPFDPAFSKKGFGVVPTYKITPPEEQHGKELYVPLYMPTALLDEYAEELDELLIENSSQNLIVKNLDALKPRDPSTLENEINTRYFSTKENSKTPKNIIYIATKKTYNNNAECKEIWEISWVNKDSFYPGIDSSETTPLYVFAYQEKSDPYPNPVTGDYDIAAFIPDHVKIRRDGSHMNNIDEHGESIISKYGASIVDFINNACGRKENPVIRHGAEAQNINFAQPLDEKLICFTPLAEAYVITKEYFAKAQFDIGTHGYLIKWNLAYEKNDISLGGKLFGIFEASDQDEDALHSMKVLKNITSELRTLYYQKYQYELLDNSIFKPSLEEKSNLEDDIFGFSEDLEKYLKDLTDRQLSTALSLQICDILKYHAELNCLLKWFSSSNIEEQPVELKYFSPSQIPTSRKIIPPHQRALFVKTIREIVLKTNDSSFDPRNIIFDTDYKLEGNTEHAVTFSDEQGMDKMSERMQNAKYVVDNTLSKIEDVAIDYDLDQGLFETFLKYFKTIQGVK